MHDETALLRQRIDRLITQRLHAARYRERAAVRVQQWETPGEPVPFAQAVTQRFTPVSNGDSWGSPWGTTWFHITGTVPAHWHAIPATRPELITDIGFTGTQTGFQCEALAYTAAGYVLKAVEPFNRYVPLEGPAVEIYLEAASNPDVINNWTFVPTEMGRRETAGTAPQYRLTEVALGLRDQEVCALLDDLTVLTGLIDVLPETSTRRARIFEALSQLLRALDPHNVAGTAPAARRVLLPALSQPAAASAHHVYAVGHAHIDSAWLWPIRETARKVARTFSNALDLLERDPDFVFAASSAQQYAWLKEQYPELFERVRAAVHHGRFVPVGGMWVEADTNLPSGESLARQFVEGARFFHEEFGVEQPEVWLPDSFGYSAALPQIMRLAGARWFLTQKISWNQVNRMPHHTFWWEGIDGTRIFTHFPPVDSYGSDLSAQDLARAERQYAEKQVGTTSLVPFGWGDGGGGPTREMLAAAHRTANLEGSPRVTLSGPREFFAAAQEELPHPPVWAGELYLETHRGTYTSQARTKRANRRSETLLREAELWSATAAVRCGTPYPAAQLREAWHTVLLNQFHDILPGSSIGWVYDEVAARYTAVERNLTSIIDTALTALGGRGERELLANAAPYPHGGVPAQGVGVVPMREATVSVSSAADGLRVITPALRATISQEGTITSLVDCATGRDAVAPKEALGRFELFWDTPAEWDAWNVDEIDRRSAIAIAPQAAVEVEEADGGRVVVLITRQIGSSRIQERLVFAGTEPVMRILLKVDWHERERLLKLAFPFDVRGQSAVSEIQYGHVTRPLHRNTSWDAAKFETVAQRWVYVGEPDYGYAIANDSVYGHDFARQTREDGGTTTQVRLSLLRAPLYPDPQADQGTHEFEVAVRLGATVADAVRLGYDVNVPPRPVRLAHTVAPLVGTTEPAMVIEAVKLAQDDSGDVVVRLYEAFGGRVRGTLQLGFTATAVRQTDLHEREVPGNAVRWDGGPDVQVSLRPFEIVTLRLVR